MANSWGRIPVPVPGTPVQVSSKHVKCHAILIEAFPSNTGKIYIGDNTLTKGVSGEFAVLAIPTLNTIPVYSETVTSAENAVDLFNYWIDADNPGDGVIISYILL